MSSNENLNDKHDILSLTVIPNNVFFLWFMVFNATFNNISVIMWRSVLLVKETGENHRPVTSH